jgi:TetR/AcrR family transcriptional regulator, tetracycline repressor protein
MKTEPDSRRNEIVRSALDLLEETGYDAVTLRAVARRLGVRLNTVSWHVKTKAGLQDLLAEAILAEIPLNRLPADWRERVLVLVRRYRRALLSHRDGARVVAGTFTPGPATLGYAEAVVEALLSGGVPHHKAGWLCWTLTYFTLGLTQEEQAVPGSLAGQLEPMISPDDYPSLSQVRPYLVDNEFDARFEFGLNLIITGDNSVD